MKTLSPAKRDLLRVGAKFLIALTLLFAPWPKLGEAVSLTFCILATTVAEGFVADRNVAPRFDPVDPSAVSEASERNWTVELAISNAATGQRSKFPLGLRQVAYVPFALFVSLVLAAPIDRRRRRTILLGGLAVFAVRLSLAVGLPMGSFLGAFEHGGLLDAAAQVVFRSLVEPPNMAYAVPVVLFLVGLWLTGNRGANGAAVDRPAHAAS